MTDMTNDDLLNELNAMPEPEKKKKKRKGKKDNQAKEEPKKEESQKKEDEKMEEEPKRVDQINEEEPKKEDEKKEEEGEEEKKNDEEEGDADENEEKLNEPKKKKKVIKKVVKKKGKGKNNKEAVVLEILKIKKKKEKELQERLIKEQAERERKEKEEEEKRLKEEEERLKREEELKLQEELKKKKLKEMGLRESEYAKLEENRKKTEEMLKKQGTNLDQLLSSFKDKKFVPKKKKKSKNKDEQKELRENPDEKDKNLINEKEEYDNEKEEIEKNNEEYLDEKDAIEEGEKVLIAENNCDDIDDWENELNDEQEEKAHPKDNNEEEKEIKEKNEKNEEREEREEKEKPKKEKQKETKKNKKEKVKEEKIIKEIQDNIVLRSPIVCVLGHVDAGKTKILDKLRHSNVQLGEAGGITQQIGATFIPIENIQSHLSKISKKFQVKTRIPGILLIDTPGHASFTNLRSRGSSLCDIAVLILNIDKGIEKQSVESIELLRMRKTPFVVALNQIDRTYNWQSFPWSGFEDSYKKQKDQQKRLFDEKVEQNQMQFIKNNINTELYYKNKNMKEYINLVPTSAITGEGLPDLMGLLVYLTQSYLIKQITFKEEVKCSILEVKVTESIGTTIDVVLVNGTIHVGDKIVIGGLLGPIKTTVKIILLPRPMKEMRVKSEYDTYEKISGAIGVRFFCPDLENALAGSPLYVYKTEEEAEKYCNEISRDFNSIVQKYISKKGKGIMVQASTLGSLEAILTFLGEQKVDVAVVGVGNLNKKDVIKLQIKHAEDETAKKEDLVILCFDNKVIPEAQQFADENGIKIFVDDVIYHLFDKFIDFKKQCSLERKKAKEKEAIFPCNLKTVMFINKKDPLILGVSVTEGILKVGTPIYCVEKNIPIGIVESIEREKKPINNVRPNDGDVAIRVKVVDSSLAAGRHFDESATFISQITRASIDALKNYFREDMTTDDWKLVIKLKKLLNIQ